jgi:hypothetical protein
MRVPRATFGPSRTVSDPDGRAWTIRVAHYRLPRPGEEVQGEDRLFDRVSGLPGIALFAPLARLVRRFWLPLLDATVGHRPWIVASAEHPPVRMVWRVTDRYSVSEAVEEIAIALGLGEPRPAPLAARWVGYDQGNVVLPHKES